MPAFFCDRSFVVYGIKTPVSHSLSRPPRLNVRGLSLTVTARSSWSRRLPVLKSYIVKIVIFVKNL